MKKIIVLLSFVVALPLMSFTDIQVNNKPQTCIMEIDSNLSPISVTKIIQLPGGAFSYSTESAQIDWDDMTLYVDEGSRKNQPYTVRTNPYKGYDDPRGEYAYCASDYYFNK